MSGGNSYHLREKNVCMGWGARNRNVCYKMEWFISFLPLAKQMQNASLIHAVTVYAENYDRLPAFLQYMEGYMLLHLDSKICILCELLWDFGVRLILRAVVEEERLQDVLCSVEDETGCRRALSLGRAWNGHFWLQWLSAPSTWWCELLLESTWKTSTRPSRSVVFSSSICQKDSSYHFLNF